MPYPPPADDPLPRRRRRRLRAKRVLDLPERRERGRVTGDLIRQRVTGHLEVDVRVDEPRHDRAAGGVEPRRRARLARHLVGRADQRDAALSDEDGLGGRLVILKRDDAAVDDRRDRVSSARSRRSPRPARRDLAGKARRPPAAALRLRQPRPRGKNRGVSCFLSGGTIRRPIAMVIGIAINRLTFPTTHEHSAAW